jgi:hypothetical protein
VTFQRIQEQIDSFSEYSLPTNFTYNATADTWSYLGTDLYRTTGLSLLLRVKKTDEETSKDMN